ncbi:MAG: hypothetical protein RO469_18365 [Thermincola sp.]|jgi:heme exporter protein C|nr:hypothetical protein [Thermincola sp.]MDT3703854.1 hypothetical protein [Thermincola sp.]
MRDTSNISFKSHFDMFLGWASFLAVTVSLYLIFMWVPNEKVQGPVSKIIYFHVSSAWLAFFAFFVVMLSGIM